jgi:hypothetical protein
LILTDTTPVSVLSQTDVRAGSPFSVTAPMGLIEPDPFVTGNVSEADVPKDKPTDVFVV